MISLWAPVPIWSLPEKIGKNPVGIFLTQRPSPGSGAVSIWQYIDILVGWREAPSECKARTDVRFNASSAAPAGWRRRHAGSRKNTRFGFISLQSPVPNLARVTDSEKDSGSTAKKQKRRTTPFLSFGTGHTGFTRHPCIRRNGSGQVHETGV